MIEDILRFPYILASPPDRIKGWASLLQLYGIAETPSTYGKMLKRAPFMFYIDPPMLFDRDSIASKSQYKYSSFDPATNILQNFDDMNTVNEIN